MYSGDAVPSDHKKRRTNPPRPTNRLEAKHLRLRAYRYLLQLPFFRFLQQLARFCHGNHKQRQRIQRKTKIQSSKNIQDNL